MSNVFLIAAQAVEGFGKNDIIPAILQIIQQLLNAGADHTRP
ncbi:MAG: hypothetical protein Q9M33_12305 [Robiginitomaculum sp.]|nr:hypothetical protein [Robiginitomaculum sp.]